MTETRDRDHLLKPLSTHGGSPRAYPDPIGCSHQTVGAYKTARGTISRPFGEATDSYVVYPSLNMRIMPSPLGHLIRNTRTERGISLRAFAKLIGKSPGFVTQLECEDEPPSVAEETLSTVAKHLKLDADELMVLANRTPRDVRPESPLEVTLYRKVKKLSASDQERVRLYLERIIRERGGR